MGLVNYIKHANILIAFLLIFNLSTSAKSEGIALIIGNANYKSAQLKNPVNDALLMDSTFLSLGYDVILDTNIQTRDEFLKILRDFNEESKSYKVVFIYYAGHAVQINGINYILATNESYSSISEVKDNGIEVQRIVDDFESGNGRINILVMDACRNNPFEANWKAKVRSGDISSGLAEVSVEGSLIAFSTSAGYTAADGNQKNSYYCQSLSKNLLKYNLGLDQIFRNVRSEVRLKTEDKQRPTTYNELEGDELIIHKSKFIDEIQEIDSLIISKNYLAAKIKLDFILKSDPQNKLALLRRGSLYLNDDSNIDIINVLKLYPKDIESLIFLSQRYIDISNYNKAFDYLNNVLIIDSTNIEALRLLIIVNYNRKSLNEALKFANKYMQLDIYNPLAYYYRANIYFDFKNYVAALNDVNEAIKLDSSIVEVYETKAKINYILGEYASAAKDLQYIVNLDPTELHIKFKLANLLKEKIYDTIAAIKIYLTIANADNTDTSSISASCLEVAQYYSHINNEDSSLYFLKKVLMLCEKRTENLYKAGNIFREINKSTLALDCYNKCIISSPMNIDYLFARFFLFFLDYHNSSLAFEDITRILSIDSLNSRALYAKGKLYENLKQETNAIIYFNKVINNKSIDSNFVAFAATSLAGIKQSKFVQKDIITAINYFKLSNQYCRSNKELYLQNLENLSRCYSALFKYDSAVFYISEALKICPDNVVNRILRADIYNLFLKNYQMAQADYFYVYSIDSSNINCLNGLGTTFKNQYKYQEAYDWFSKGTQLENCASENLALSFLERALLWEYLPLATNQVIRDFNSAINFSNNSNGTYYKLKGDYELKYLKSKFDALQDYNIATQIDSLNSAYFVDRGFLLANAFNDNESAIIDFKKAISLDKNNEPYLLNWIGVFYDRMLFNDSATFYFQKVLNLISKSNNYSERQFKHGIAWAYSNLAEEFLRNEKNDSALLYFNQALKYDSLNPVRYYYRGCCYAFYFNDSTHALNDLRNAIRLSNGIKGQFNYNLTLVRIYKYFRNYNEAQNEVIRYINYLKSNDNYNLTLAKVELAKIRWSFGLYSNANSILDTIYQLDSLNKYVIHAKIDLNCDTTLDYERMLLNNLKSFPDDTLSLFKLGLFNFQKSNYLVALKYFNATVNSIIYNPRYLSSQLDVQLIFLSDVQIEIARVYKKLNCPTLMMEALEQVKNELNDEMRNDKQIMRKKILDLMVK